MLIPASAAIISLVLRGRTTPFFALVTVGCSLTSTLDELAGSASSDAGDSAASTGGSGGTWPAGGSAGQDAASGSGGVATGGAAADASEADAADAGPPCHLPLADDFEDGVVSAAWDVLSDNGSKVEEKLGRLFFTLAASAPANTWAGLQAKQSYDLTGCSVYVHVLGVPIAPTAYLSLGASQGTLDGVELTVFQGELRAVTRKGGVKQVAKLLPFSATAHAWWRIREKSGNVHWDVSADGKTWNALASAAAPSALNAVIVWIGIGTDLALTQQTQASIDKFDVPP